MHHVSARRRLQDPVRERGQVVVMFALLVPVFLALGGVGHRDRQLVHAREASADEGRRRGVRRRKCLGLSVRCERRPGRPGDRGAGARIRRAAYRRDGNRAHERATTRRSAASARTRFMSCSTDPTGTTTTRTLEPRTGPHRQARSASRASSTSRSPRTTRFPLASLIPLYPDIKRKARVQIEEVEGVSGLLPIAVRVPKPLSAAAVFYNEATGIDPQHQVLLPGRRHSRASRRDSAAGRPIRATRPTHAAHRPRGRPSTSAPTTGVVIATSFRPACNTPGVVAPCFDDNFTNVNSLCNQGTSTQVVQCFYATGIGTSAERRVGPAVHPRIRERRGSHERPA